MNFRQALAFMKTGGKVKRPHWSGYWAFENGTIMMHTKEGEVLDLFDTKMRNIHWITWQQWISRRQWIRIHQFWAVWQE